MYTGHIIYVSSDIPKNPARTWYKIFYPYFTTYKIFYLYSVRVYSDIPKNVPFAFRKS